MSDKLKSVAEPWTSRLSPDPPEADVAFVYEASSLIWNASRLSDRPRQNKALREARRLIAQALPTLPPSAVESLIDEIFQRAIQLYPDDPRMIVRTSVERRGESGYHISVASLDPS
jgi:hypothetical protein